MLTLKVTVRLLTRNSRRLSTPELIGPAVGRANGDLCRLVERKSVDRTIKATQAWTP